MERASALNGWVNTIDSENPEVIEKARSIIKNNLYCTLSTCSNDAHPWVSPVFFAYDDKWNIYWISALASKHSQNLYENKGRVALVIFDSRVAEGKASGLYFNGTASELGFEQVNKAMSLLANRIRKKTSRKAEHYLNDSPRKIYQFRPLEAWLTGEQLAIDDDLIDTKIQINLRCM